MEMPTNSQSGRTMSIESGDGTKRTPFHFKIPRPDGGNWYTNIVATTPEDAKAKARTEYIQAFGRAPAIGVRTTNGSSSVVNF